MHGEAGTAAQAVVGEEPSGELFHTLGVGPLRGNLGRRARLEQ